MVGRSEACSVATFQELDTCRWRACMSFFVFIACQIVRGRVMYRAASDKTTLGLVLLEEAAAVAKVSQQCCMLSFVP